MLLIAALLVVFAYLLGSIPTGYIIGLMAGVDVRASGSGNVGATNVARVVGKREGIMTLLGDAGKGLLPVLIASVAGLTPEWVAAAGVAAFLGHVFPVFLKFKGGKGVATALGVFLGIVPLATLLLIGVFAAVVFATRMVSLSSLAAAVLAPVVVWLLAYPRAFVAASTLVAIVIILRHRANIGRLIAGTEPKFS